MNDMELVRIEDAVRAIKKAVGTGDPACQAAVLAVQYDTPKVEGEPVRHGRWVETEPDEDDRKIGIEFSIKCSRCHDENSHLDFNENHEITGKTFWKSRFCPNCGAKMDGGAENG